MVGGSAARQLGYFALLMGASIMALFSALELPSIGWQLFILGSSQSDATAFPSFLDTHATRLLTEPLSGDPLHQVRGEGACVVLGSIVLWFCIGRRVLLLEVAVKSEISIYPGPHRPHCER
jgi:hypothetical protein